MGPGAKSAIDGTKAVGSSFNFCSITKAAANQYW